MEEVDKLHGMKASLGSELLARAHLLHHLKLITVSMNF
jgi:hypothetical protein